MKWNGMKGGYLETRVKKKQFVDVQVIETWASRMRSERSATELHTQDEAKVAISSIFTTTNNKFPDFPDDDNRDETLCLPLSFHFIIVSSLLIILPSLSIFNNWSALAIPHLISPSRIIDSMACCTPQDPTAASNQQIENALVSTPKDPVLKMLLLGARTPSAHFSPFPTASEPP